MNILGRKSVAGMLSPVLFPLGIVGSHNWVGGKRGASSFLTGGKECGPLLHAL